MTVEPAIHFEDVSKRFEFNTDKPQSVLETIIGSISRKRSTRSAELWALKNASFTVRPGQSFGIIGRNGSGKSTLLKLASGIIRPSSGRVIVHGRVSALLELGAGFHGDLTGQENIYLNASILGLTSEDIAKCYDDIVAFSELQDFIHMPVKHYSSGMYMRLGFSVAVHVGPDILIIDEILAVGDQPFQDKCIDRIYDLKQLGTTIVFVSHNLDVVQNLCTELVWMDKGDIKAIGPTHEVISVYRQHLFQDQRGKDSSKLEGRQINRWGSREVEITGVRLVNGRGEITDTFQLGQEMVVEISYLAKEPIRQPEFGLIFYRQDGIQVSGPNNREGGLEIEEVHGRGVVRYEVKELPLLPAKYIVSVAIHDGRLPKVYDFHEEAYSFRVVSSSSFALHGIIDLPATWNHVSESLGMQVEHSKES